MPKIKKLFPQSFKNICHLFQAFLANLWRGFPSGRVKVIGITGTDGKTTTTQMIAAILQQAGKKVAVASTINFKINGEEEENLSHLTTESPFALQKFVRRAVDAGCEYLVLEVSSHSLDQYRTWGVEFQTAVITNVTREHLDYHRTMEKYRSAKKKLFKIAAKNKGALVVNLEMEKPEEFLDFENVRRYGYATAIGNQSSVTSNNSEVQIVKAERIKLEISGSEFVVQATSFRLLVPGLFNVENALAAICVALEEGIDLEVASEALFKIKGVAGRMEAVANDLGVNILVDFALTPNALKRLYEQLSASKKPAAKLIAVFGACGDRDRGKRPIIGKIVSDFADLIILTDDEPYHEDPQKIIDAIFAGIENKTEDENLWRIPDRRQAIAKALALAKTDDIVCVSGMGNFEGMVVGDEKLPWNDRRVIEEELAKLRQGASNVR